MVAEEESQKRKDDMVGGALLLSSFHARERCRWCRCEGERKMEQKMGEVGLGNFGRISASHAPTSCHREKVKLRSKRVSAWRHAGEIW